MVNPNVQSQSHVLFKNQSFRNAATYSRYLRNFCNRHLYPSFSIHPSTFTKYGMNIPAYLHRLGWESLVENLRFSQCPEAVRLFYVNFRCGPGSDPSFFTTLVYDYEIKVTPDILASILHLPHSGYQAGTDREFFNFGFRFDEVLRSLAHDIGRWFPSQLAAGSHWLRGSAQQPAQSVSIGCFLITCNAAAAAFKQDATSRCGPKRRLLLEQDLMLPKFVYETNQISDPISPDTNSDDEDRVSRYASPPKYPF
ncbi:unnamed protein product [Linum trigynum]|uniref:Uncharacterized protein n=1 Tax=Linum trigynum TaxID=586398 RepID=A0AAV2E3I9_9ROSI